VKNMLRKLLQNLYNYAEYRAVSVDGFLSPLTASSREAHNTCLKLHLSYPSEIWVVEKITTNKVTGTTRYEIHDSHRWINSLQFFAEVKDARRQTLERS
jgi:hypothetical protein